MARIRSIKPSFFQSDDVSALPLRARLTWIGLWTHCDDAGRSKDHVRLIKAAIWPLDTQVSLADVEEDLSTLAAHGRIVRYEVDGERFLEITNWSEHQKINRPTESKIPPPTAVAGNGGLLVRPTAAAVQGSKPRPIGAAGQGTAPPPTAVAVASRRPPGILTEPSLQEGKGKEGKGGDVRASAREPPPPRTCPKHPAGTDDPCRACQRARQAHETWQADKRTRLAAGAKCRRHAGQPADNCAICRSEELNPA